MGKNEGIYAMGKSEDDIKFEPLYHCENIPASGKRESGVAEQGTRLGQGGDKRAEGSAHSAATAIITSACFAKRELGVNCLGNRRTAGGDQEDKRG